MPHQIKNNRKGQSILEALIAIGIFSAVAGALAVIIFGAQQSVVDAENSTTALEYGNEGLQATQLIKNKNWDLLTDGDHGLAFGDGDWQFLGTSDTRDIFTRVINISTIDSDTKLAIAKITWQTDILRPQTATTSVRLTNWQPIDTGGLTGDWTRPQSFGSVDLGAGESATGLKVRNKIVYMTAKASSAAKPDFFIINATNPSAPSVVSSLNTGPGLNAVAINGNYAYVANNSSSNQLQIIDISNINAPVLVKSFTLPQNSEEALSVFAASNLVYMGTEKDNGAEFFIIDASNPLNPSVVKSLEIGDDVNKIKIFQKKAYLATPIDTKELIVINVSDPANAAEVGSFDMLGNSEEGKSVAIYNSGHVYLTRTVGGNHTNHHELGILNASNPVAIQLLGSKDIPADVNDIALVQNLAFLATSDSNAEFKIYNVADPANITLYASFNFSQIGTGISYESNYIYMSVRSNDALRIITSSP